VSTVVGDGHLVTRETWSPLLGAALATFGVTHKPPVLNHAPCSPLAMPELIGWPAPGIGTAWAMDLTKTACHASALDRQARKLLRAARVRSGGDPASRTPLGLPEPKPKRGGTDPQPCRQRPEAICRA